MEGQGRLVFSDHGPSLQILLTEHAVVQGPAHRPIRVAPVLTDVSLAKHAAALGHARAAEVGVITVDGYAQRADGLEQQLDDSSDGLSHKAASLVIDIHKVADLILGKLDIPAADVDLRYEGARLALEGTQEEVGST